MLLNGKICSTSWSDKTDQMGIDRYRISYKIYFIYVGQLYNKINYIFGGKFTQPPATIEECQILVHMIGSNDNDEFNDLTAMARELKKRIDEENWMQTEYMLKKHLTPGNYDY